MLIGCSKARQTFAPKMLRSQGLGWMQKSARRCRGRGSPLQPKRRCGYSLFIGLPLETRYQIGRSGNLPAAVQQGLARHMHLLQSTLCFSDACGQAVQCCW
jgi:hypothetical protein